MRKEKEKEGKENKLGDAAVIRCGLFTKVILRPEVSVILCGSSSKN